MAYEDRVENFQKFKDISYYIIIGVVSFMSVAFLPFVGSALEGELVLPDSPIAWAIWGITKLFISLINIVIFHSFLKQAKINIKDNIDYLEAVKKLALANKHKNLRPRSPKRYFGRIWGTKGTTLFITSFMSAIVLGESVLMFDLNVFLSYLFTVFMAVVFGYLQMRASEEYWVEEFPAYADDELSRVELERQEVKEC